MKARIYIGLFVSLVGGLLFAEFGMQKSQSQATLKQEILKLDCPDISQPCGNDLFTVHLMQKPQVMKPMALSLHFNQTKTVRDVHASFAMQSMEMGLNRYRLMPVGGDWQAEVTLPVCVQGRSDWNMLLEIELHDGIERFLVPFSATKN